MSDVHMGGTESRDTSSKLVDVFYVFKTREFHAPVSCPSDDVLGHLKASIEKEHPDFKVWECSISTCQTYITGRDGKPVFCDRCLKESSSASSAMWHTESSR
jgi:hypothetical protein